MNRTSLLLGLFISSLLFFAGCKEKFYYEMPFPPAVEEIRPSCYPLNFEGTNRCSHEGVAATIPRFCSIDDISWDEDNQAIRLQSPVDVASIPCKFRINRKAREDEEWRTRFTILTPYPAAPADSNLVALDDCFEDGVTTYFYRLEQVDSEGTVVCTSDPVSFTF